jgi:Arc/MetJ-type ribon-helix-helix transcriptional regulator
MPVTEPKETLHLTLDHKAAEEIRRHVSSGVYASESEYIESIVLSDTLFEPIDQKELVHWINTEGVRRLDAMKADPSQCLTHDEFWATIEKDEETDNGADQPSEGA